MTVESQQQRPWYFNLKADGDSAVVRILHTSTSTIESTVSHRIMVDGKNRRLKCLGETCPLCKNGNDSDTRIYIHLFDYTDNKEKIWERTDKILPQLTSLQGSWSPLNSAVVRITRKGNEFPKYDIEVLNPASYANVDASLIDQQLAKYYCMNRKEDEIQQFLSTGKFPERKAFVSKEEYYKQKQQEQSIAKVEPVTTENEASSDSVDDPFMTDVISIKKV